MDQEDGFNNRVDKVFGCVTTTSSSTTSSQLSLTDAQIERRVWKHNRDDDGNNKRDDETPSSFTSYSCCLDNMFKRPPNKSNNPTTNNKGDDPDDDEEEWEIQRSSIGMDPTLDFEEEEDSYDKMAQGREENADDDDRLYMKDVTHHGPDLNSHNVLPTSLHHVKKDPRANHHAAITRLKEDDDTLEGSDEPMLNTQEIQDEPCAATVPEPATDDAIIRIKSILKRKNEDFAKPAKRVRFDPTCKNNDYLQRFAVHQVKPENGPGVPDYIVNPSKYTRYTFDDDDDDDDDVNNKSNTEAYLELEQIKKSKEVGLEQHKPPTDDFPPTSVVFIPRKKRGNTATCNSEGQVKQSSTSHGLSIATVEIQQGEVSEMQEDESNLDALSIKPRFQKPGRRYRSKMEEDDNGC